MNKILFMKEWKSSYQFLIAFALILTMYMTIMITMFDPKLGSVLDQFAQAMPEIMAFVGMNQAGTTLVGFLSSYLYGMLMIAFPMIFVVMLSIRLIARQVDNGFMGYLLASPNSRRTVSMTQMTVLLANIILLITYCTILGIVCSEIFFPGSLDIAAFIRLNLGLVCLHLAFGGFTFLISSVFNESRVATTIASGVPILFLLTQMLSNMGGNLENLKYATIITLFDAEGLIANSSNSFMMAGGLLLISIICFSMAHLIFNKKDMPL